MTAPPTHTPFLVYSPSGPPANIWKTGSICEDQEMTKV